MGDGKRVTDARFALAGVAAAARKRIFFPAALLACTVQGIGAQNTTISTPTAAPVRLTARLHVQLATSSVDGAEATDLFSRRARLALDASISRLLEARIQPEFSAGTLSLKDAYLRFNVDPALWLMVGQLKRAFDLFELDSTTDIVVVERTGGIDGMKSCPGPGGTCTVSRFTNGLAYSNRAVGVRVEGSVGSRMAYMATITVAGRISLHVGDRVRIGANVSRHNSIRATGRGLVDGTGAATAFGADLEVGSFRDGTHLQVGVVTGANWLLNALPGENPRFLVGQAILSRFFPTAGETFTGVEPVARVSWGDPHWEGGNDAAWLLTPGVFLYISEKNRIGANFDI